MRPDSRRRASLRLDQERRARSRASRPAQRRRVTRIFATARQPHRLSKRRLSMIQGISLPLVLQPRRQIMLRFRRRIPLRQAIARWRQSSCFHRGKRPLAIARVANSNDLLDLADKVTSAPAESGHSRSNAPNGRTSRGTGSVSLGKGRPLSPVRLTPADLALAGSGARRPAALP